MGWLRNSQLARSVLVPLGLITWLSACTQPVIHTSPYEGIVRDAPREVTVVLDDDTRTKIRQPRIVDDSLIGLVYDARSRRYQDTVSFSFAEMHRVEQAKASPTGLMLVLAIPVALFLEMTKWDTN